MSSKSRKKTARPADKRALAPAAGSVGSAGAPPSREHGKSAFDIPDEIFHAPKEKNRLRFALMIVLVVILLIIFLVPDSIQNMFGRSQGNATIVTWQHPTEGEIELSSLEYYNKKRALDAALGIDYALKVFTFGIAGQTLSDQDAMRLIILERLARDAGVQITQADLREHLQELVQRSFQGSRELYLGYVARVGGVTLVEENLRSLLRARRYLDLLGYVAQIPDPDAIEKLWAEEHVEFAFDYVELETSTLAEEARGALPGDEELTAWYDALPEAERGAYMSPEQRRGEVAFYLVGASAPEGLLAAFPRPETESADDEAQNYYNRFYFVRFKRPPQEEPSDGGDESEAGEAESGEEGAQSGGEDEELPQYLPFDEVRDACLAEAPVYFALERWLRDLQTRKSGGESIDLAAEAARHGLGLRVNDAPLGLAELGTFLEDLGGTPVATMVFSTQPGEFAFNVQVQPGALSVVRVLERTEPKARPFAEVRDQVVEAWVLERARKLAEERLAALREGLPLLAESEDGAEDAEDAQTTEDAQANDETAQAGGEDAGDAEDAKGRRSADEASFRAAAEAAGFSVLRRDWLDRSGAPTEDPQLDAPAHLFLQSHREYYELAENEVPPPAVDMAAKRVYLVRLAGRRDIPIARMTPAVYENYKQRTAATARMAVGQGYSESLEELYGVHFAHETAKDDAPPAQ